MDAFGVHQPEGFSSPHGTGASCLLEGPDEEAVRKHHGGRCGDPLRVESLL